MAINLSRNTRVFFTTNVTQTASGATAVATIVDAASGFTTANTFELQVLSGYSFGQATQSQAITVNEAGATPTRGQRAFNTSLDTASWSFTTYIRPVRDGSSIVAPAERVLWNAMLGNVALDTAPMTFVTALPLRGATAGVGSTTASAVLTGVATGLSVGSVVNITGSTDSDWNVPMVLTSVTASTNTTIIGEFLIAPPTSSPTACPGTTTTCKAYAAAWAPSSTAAGDFSYVSTMGSNKQTLQKFGLIFIVDNQIYALDNCAVDQASIDFGLDAIAQIAWTGKSTYLKPLSTITGSYLTSGANATTANTAANYITNRLSTMTLQSNIGGAQAASSTSYTVAITGGNVTIANNLNYLVPANLGVVNTPIGYYVGTRSVTGSVTAYLRTGTAGDPGSLLTSLLNNISTLAETKYRTQLEMGGAANGVKVEFEMPATVIQIPSVNVADVVSTEIKFTAEAFNPDVNTQTTANQFYDLTRTNELQVRYFST